MAGPEGDLRIPPASGLPFGATIPAGELTERFSKSSGPGGQALTARVRTGHAGEIDQYGNVPSSPR